jgi:hypothetical protein
VIPGKVDGANPERCIPETAEDPNPEICIPETAEDPNPEICILETVEDPNPEKSIPETAEGPDDGDGPRFLVPLAQAGTIIPTRMKIGMTMMKSGCKIKPARMNLDCDRALVTV